MKFLLFELSRPLAATQRRRSAAHQVLRKIVGESAYTLLVPSEVQRTRCSLRRLANGLKRKKNFKTRVLSHSFAAGVPMDGEEANALFLFLRSQSCEDLWKSAARPGTIVVIPRCASLPPAEHIDRAFAEAHVLRSTGVFANDYAAVSQLKRVATVQNTVVIVGQGYPKPGLRSRIINETNFYGEEGGAVRCVYVQVPLTSEAPSVAKVLWNVLRGRLWTLRPLLPADASVRDAIDWLKSDPSNEAAIENMKKGLERLRIEHHVVSSMPPAKSDAPIAAPPSCVAISAELSDIIDAFAAELLSSNQRLAKLCVDPTRRAELQSMCEDLCISNAHSWLMLMIQKHCGLVDAALDKNISLAQGLTLEHFDVDPRFHVPLHDAINCLTNMFESTTPRSKLLELSRMMQLVENSIKRNLSSSDSVALSADDLLPIVVFVVIQSRVIHMEKCGEMSMLKPGVEGDVQQLIDRRHSELSSGSSPLVVATLCSTLIFMETFMMSAGSSGNLSYSLAMFQAAVEYIKTYKQGSAKPRTRIKTLSRNRRSSISAAIEDRFVVAARQDAVRNNCYVWGITGALSSSAAGGSLPEIMQSLNIVSSISCGSKHCLAVDRQGRCFTWGWGGDGQLGHGSCDDLPAPTHVTHIRDTVVQVAGGSGHSVALTSSGTVFTWGMHLKGQLGREVDSHGDAALVPGVVSVPNFVCDVAAGGDSTFAYSEQFGLFAWGCNLEGQLGLGNKDLSSVAIPQQVAALANVHLLNISVANSHALFIDLQSRVWGCGSNSNGQLGYGSDTKSLLSPTLLPSLKGIDILSVACGFSCSLFLTAAGQVLQAGQISIKLEASASSEQVLADPASSVRSSDDTGTPVQAIDPDSQAARMLLLLGADPASPPIEKKIFSMHAVSDFVDSRGRLIGCPQHLSILPLDSRDPVVCISAGSFHAGCVTQGGIIYTLGDGDRGQLGHGMLSSTFVPTAVPSLAGLHIQSISCGFWHSMCLVRPGGEKLSSQEAATNISAKTDVTHDDWIVLRENLLFSSKMWCSVRNGFMLLYSRQDAPAPKTVISLEVAGVTDVSLVGSFGFTLTVINKKYQFLCESELQLESWINVVTFAKIEARTHAGTLDEIVGDASTMNSDDLRKRLTTGTTMCKLVLHNKNRRHLRLVSVPKDANCIMWQDLNSDADTHQVLLRDISEIKAGFTETGRAITESGGSLDWARCLTIVTNERSFEFEADSEEQAILWEKMLAQLLDCHKMKRSPW